jgi:hypothetical protein
LGGSTYRDAVAFAVLILILLLRPPACWAAPGGEGLMLPRSQLALLARSQ